MVSLINLEIDTTTYDGVKLLNEILVLIYFVIVALKVTQVDAYNQCTECLNSNECVYADYPKKYF